MELFNICMTDPPADYSGDRCKQLILWIDFPGAKTDASVFAPRKTGGIFNAGLRHDSWMNYDVDLNGSMTYMRKQLCRQDLLASGLELV